MLNLSVYNIWVCQPMVELISCLSIIIQGLRTHPACPKMEMQFPENLLFGQANISIYLYLDGWTDGWIDIVMYIFLFKLCLFV